MNVGGGGRGSPETAGAHALRPTAAAGHHGQRRRERGFRPLPCGAAPCARARAREGYGRAAGGREETAGGRGNGGGAGFGCVVVRGRDLEHATYARAACAMYARTA
jgi:hypothetical protein